MALIKCPECDREISDHALDCPQCGYPISKDFVTRFCPECSQSVRSKEKTCLECGYPFRDEVPDKRDSRPIYENQPQPQHVKLAEPVPSLWDLAIRGIKPKVLCPYCSERGKVGMKEVDRKRGIHGGKATAGIFTGGISLLATGLSRKEKSYEYKCYNCESKWIG